MPIHPKVRLILDDLPMDEKLVIPGLRDRWVLVHVKAVCKRLGYSSSYKTHSFRHFFASMVANTNVPYRMALAWMGHSSSTILDLYYHLHDTESEAAMKGLAKA